MAVNGIVLAARVQEACMAEGIRLALAESCTGGYISDLLTSVPGSSGYLTCSIVAYSNDAKTRLLGVEKSLMEKHGAISPECALEMAAGAARVANTEVALSVTGNLGPNPIEGKDTGLVYIAVYLRDKAGVMELRLKGDRNSIKRQAAGEALAMLLSELSNGD